MAWTTPMTATANQTLTAAQWNTNVRDNLNETMPNIVKNIVSTLCFTDGANSLVERRGTSARISSSQSTTSTSYTDLATPGPTVTLTTGTIVLVIAQAQATNSGSTSTHHTSWAISGATTLAASDVWAISDRGTANNQRAMVYLHTGLTAGTNTFRMKYNVLSGTGTWAKRHLAVIPLS